MAEGRFESRPASIASVSRFSLLPAFPEVALGRNSSGRIKESVQTSDVNHEQDSHRLFDMRIKGSLHSKPVGYTANHLWSDHHLFPEIPENQRVNILTLPGG
jgi:hypothetical protein